jgi:hypothetical protein
MRALFRPLLAVWLGCLIAVTTWNHCQGVGLPSWRLSLWISCHPSECRFSGGAESIAVIDDTKEIKPFVAPVCDGEILRLGQFHLSPNGHRHLLIGMHSDLGFPALGLGFRENRRFWIIQDFQASKDRRFECRSLPRIFNLEIAGGFGIGPQIVNVTFVKRDMDVSAQLRAGSDQLHEADPNQAARYDGEQYGGERRYSHVILGGELASTRPVEAKPPYDSAADNGSTLMKGLIGFIILAIMYALMKRF